MALTQKRFTISQGRYTRPAGKPYLFDEKGVAIDHPRTQNRSRVLETS